MSHVEIIAENSVMRDTIEKVRAKGRIVGFVPTMGALHAGHLSLIEEAKNRCDVTVVSIFVNPLQFDEQCDLKNYPRDLAADISSLQQLSVDYVFTPSPEQMYRSEHCMSVDVGELAHLLEGRFRPGHFSGVATVLMKLFHLIPANIVFFGTKDYQQLKVVQQVVEDSNLPIEIVGCPTVREEDGLAMSSRNRLLSHEERQRAKCVFESLELAQKIVAEGERDPKNVIHKMRKHLHRAGVKIDYVALVNPDTLYPEKELVKNALALVAVRMGSIRLIDNRPIQRGAG